MQNWLNRIVESISANGHQTYTWKTGDGQLLLMPHAARILACDMSTAGIRQNLFYHHPALEDPDTAIEQLNGCTMAGDRLWIAPEIAYMWHDLELARRDPLADYRLNPDMDPGHYETVECRDGHLLVCNELKLTDHRVNRNIHLRVERQFSASKKPDLLPDEIKSVSFTITNHLILLDGDDGALAGGWDILQVPATPAGTLICPTIKPVHMPRSYYDPYGDHHVDCDPQSVRFLIDAKNRIKMGLSPMQTSGRMGYYQKHEHASSLILRIFNVLSGEPYVDLPRESDQMVGGDCLQAYNDNQTYGRFGEMEYHDPAIIVGQTCHSRQSTCVTHVLVGPDEQIRSFGQQLLGMPITSLVVNELR